ncbi:MAG: hypothetical protein A2X64_01840 [Ignavibacteria bacterium GWF2_33_9]|nr:MAG: hypothetical protein A2X64_01840 [Ignavibacteria bacterium GWF2_33_9]
MMQHKFIILPFFLIFAYSVLLAGSAGTNYTYETQTVVSMPTAGLIPSSGQLFSLNMHGKSGLMFQVEYSPINNALIGISFGGTGMFGNEKISFQKFPGFEAKYRLINEKKYLPAIAVGFNSQGLGIFENNEFQVNSPGFYLALSKAFKWNYGLFAIHFGTNYSLEQRSDIRKLNAYFGLEHSISRQSSINFEYDFNSPYNPDFDAAKGKTNLSFRYSIENVTTLELKLMDVFGTRGDVLRFLKIEFVGFIF